MPPSVPLFISQGLGHIVPLIIPLSTLIKVDDFKWLGVVFSSSISFSSHIDALCKKISQLTGFVIRIFRHLLSVASCIDLFEALILPHLTFCAIVWNPCQIGLHDRLDKGQRKISKVLIERGVHLTCRTSQD